MLQTLDDTTIKTQQLWLQFMLMRVGHNYLPSLLEYYESIGWISTEASERLIALAENEKLRHEGPSWTLSPEEHRVSMLFIEKLMGKQVELPVLPALPRKVNFEQKDRSYNSRNGYLEAHQKEKEDLEFTLHRHEITIKNLEQELEKRDTEIGKLKARNQELEKQNDEYQNELKKNRIYREVLEENIRLRKAAVSKRLHVTL
ncbi:MAG TPA: FlaD/FlaE family flagellar protein [Candidatus Methanoperedens sp.]|nr:hypothetical protein [Candidatus Methanoperedens sp.]HLB70917.1 FlaD/FlaE family flagellar protein [Candidatus Methanoperedens sp.]